MLKQQAFWFEAKRAPILAAKKAIEFFEAFDGDTRNGDVFIPDANGVGSGTAGHLMEQVDEATGNEIALDLSFTVNKLTSGQYTGIYMDVTETDVNSGNSLIDLSVGTVSQFRVNGKGNVWK